MRALVMESPSEIENSFQGEELVAAMRNPTAA